MKMYYPGIRFARLLLATILPLFIAVTKTGAQLTLFSESDFGGTSFEHPLGGGLEIAATDLSNKIRSLKVSNGYKVTLYAAPNYGGPSMVFYGGTYSSLPDIYGSAVTETDAPRPQARLLNVGSYVLEQVQAGDHITLWYAVKYRQENIRYNAYNQNVGIGSFQQESLIGTPSMPDHVEIWPKIWMNSITVPHGFVVTLVSPEGSTVRLVNDNETGAPKIFNTDNYPEIHQNIVRVEVTEARYKIERIILQAVEKIDYLVHESSRAVDNTKSTDQVFSLDEMVQEYASVNSQYSGHPLHLVRSENVQIEFDASAIPDLRLVRESLGRDGDPRLQNLFKQAVLASVGKSFSSGYHQEERIAYPLQEHCEINCPPGSRCNYILTERPMDILCQATITFAQITPESGQVAGSDFTINSRFLVHVVDLGDCRQADITPLSDLPAESAGSETVELGDLTWMTTNLNSLTCQDGTPIDTSNIRIQGNQVMYNINALETCDICPSGWRLPTSEDFRSFRELGKSGEEIRAILNMNEASFGGFYLHIKDARVYYDDVTERGASLTVKGTPADYHPVRCVKGQSVSPQEASGAAEPAGREASLVGHWTFEGNNPLKDLKGNFGDLELMGSAKVEQGVLKLGNSAWARGAGYKGPSLKEKTLVSWVRLDDLALRAGSVLTLDKTDKDDFDGIIYAEREAGRWMAGSTSYLRTDIPKPGYQEVQTGELIMMAISYWDNAGEAQVKIYRNGELIGEYSKGKLSDFGSSSEILFGTRHTSGNNPRGFVNARIEEARIYNKVLSEQALKDLMTQFSN